MGNSFQIYLDNVLLRIPGNIYWKDKNGKYLGCNNVQAKLAGFNSPSDMIGKTDYELPWHDIADILCEVDQRIMRTCVPEELIETPSFPDGTKIIMLTNKAPLFDDKGDVIGIIGVSLDITDYKEMEARERLAIAETAAALAAKKAEEEARRAITILAGSIVHDLRTPLSILNLMNFDLDLCLPVLLNCYYEVKKLELDIYKEFSDKQKESIDHIAKLPKKIEEIVKRMTIFIDDNLKAIKRSNQSSLKDEDLVECKSYKMISNALEAYPFKEGEKKLISWNREYYFNFLGNPILFLRIMFNLLNNSFYQIHKNGKGEIFISSEERENANLIKFRDTAGGAPDKIVRNIFDGYVTTKEEGTGVGLAFCKLTMNSFGGDISCHSVEGEFIEFTLIFPKIGI